MAAYKRTVRNLNWDISYTDAMRPQVQRMMVLYERELIARRKPLAKAGSTTSTRKRREVEF
jgi:hypothetical protein